MSFTEDEYQKNTLTLLSAMNDNLKSIEKALASLAEVYGQAQPCDPAPDCVFVNTGVSIEGRPVCKSPSACLYKEPVAGGYVCCRYYIEEVAKDD